MRLVFLIFQQDSTIEHHYYVFYVNGDDDNNREHNASIPIAHKSRQAVREKFPSEKTSSFLCVYSVVCIAVGFFSVSDSSCWILFSLALASPQTLLLLNTLTASSCLCYCYDCCCSCSCCGEHHTWRRQRRPLLNMKSNLKTSVTVGAYSQTVRFSIQVTLAWVSLRVVFVRRRVIRVKYLSISN